MWKRWNQTSHVWERSVDNGLHWDPLPINAASINEGTLPNDRFAPWVDRAYDPTDFTCDGGMTISIPAAGNMSVNKSQLTGKVMHWMISINAFTLGGAKGNIYITIPQNQTGGATGIVGYMFFNNPESGANWAVGQVSVNAGSQQLNFIHMPAFQWTPGGSNNYMWANVTLPVL